MLAMGGTYIVTRLVTSSIRERFVNQLHEASRIASDSIVRQERFHLETLRLMTFTDGMWDALMRQDTAGIQERLLPLAINNNVDLVSAVNLEGQELVTLAKGTSSDQYNVSTGANFSSLYLVNNILTGNVDNQGDKYIQMIETSTGWALCTSAPVRDENDQVVRHSNRWNPSRHPAFSH